jgi:preprotein translocase subunit SecA
LLKFDDVMNDQRKVVYEQRKDIMRTPDVAETVSGMRMEVIDAMVARCIPENAYAEKWDTHALHEEVLRIFGLDLPIAEWAKEEGIAEAEIRERITAAATRKAAEKAANYGPEIMRMAEKSLLLQILDQMWKDHLLTLDHLRQGINLRAYGQRDPLNEYKREAFELFETLLSRLREQVTGVLSHIELRIQQNPDMEMQMALRQRELTEGRSDPAEGAGSDNDVSDARAWPRTVSAGAAPDPRDPASWGKVSRNAACPCGSGKKYKHCHGKL